MARLSLRSLLAGAALGALLLAPADATAERFRLVVTGGTFVDFKGDCRLVDQRGFEVLVRLVGHVPQGYAITAEAVACEVQNSDLTGRLTVRLERNGALVARGTTRSGLGEVEVRSAGPWGEARATVKVLPLVFRDTTPPSRQPGLPSLNPPIVPPLSARGLPPLSAQGLPPLSAQGLPPLSGPGVPPLR
ncbi:MAG: hypothetical protein L0210_07410 [Rhodospirillales bacterium]|nr:hypothetical protein [Rhodospirillales bacterium]